MGFGAGVLGERGGQGFGVVPEFVGFGSGFGVDLLGLFTDFRGAARGCSKRQFEMSIQGQGFDPDAEDGRDSRGEEVVGGTGTDDSDGGVDGGVATPGVTGRRGRRRVLTRRRRGRGDGGSHGPLNSEESQTCR